MPHSDDFTWRFRLFRWIAQVIACVAALCLFWMVLSLSSWIFAGNTLYFLIFFGCAAVVVLAPYFVWFVSCLFRGKWDDDYPIPAEERVVLFGRCAGIAAGYVFGCVGCWGWALWIADVCGNDLYLPNVFFLVGFLLFRFEIPVVTLLLAVAWLILVRVSASWARSAAEKRCR